MPPSCALLADLQLTRNVSEYMLVLALCLVTFRVRHSRGEMYIGHGRLYVCHSVPRRIPTLLYGPGCNLEEW